MDNYLYPAAMALLSPDFGYAGTAPAVRTLLGGRPLPESTGCRTELGKDGTLVIDYRDGHLVLTERPHFFRVVMFASSCMTHLDKGTNAGGVSWGQHSFFLGAAQAIRRLYGKELPPEVLMAARMAISINRFMFGLGSDNNVASDFRKILIAAGDEGFIYRKEHPEEYKRQPGVANNPTDRVSQSRTKRNRPGTDIAA